MPSDIAGVLRAANYDSPHLAMIDRRELYDLTREQLIARAGKLGVTRPEVLTQAELTDEIITRSTTKSRRRKMRGWLGRARDLVARVVERGLHLPDAAKRFSAPPAQARPKPPPPLPTMTLAEIYAAQGYAAKAVEVLDEVLVKEPTHPEAMRLRDKLLEKLSEGELAARQKRLVATILSPKSKEAAPAGATTGDQAAPVPAAGSPSPESVPTDRPATSSQSESDDSTKPTSPPAMLLDVQELVALATNADTAYVYWEVMPRRFAQLRAKRPHGRLVLRALCSTPQKDNAMHDLYVDELRGDTFVRGLEAESNVQFCLGYKVGSDFEAIVVGDTLAMPRDYRRELGVEATPSDTTKATKARGRTADEGPSPQPESSPMASSTSRPSPESRVASTHLRDGIPRWASSHWLGAAAAGGLATHPAPKTSSGAGLGQWSARSMAASGAGVAVRSKSGAGLH